MHFTEVDKGTKVDVQVREEDQMRINEFSRNNARMTEIEAELTQVKRRMETLVDAADTLEEVSLEYEKGDIKLMVGESFIEVGETTAEEYVETQKKKIEKVTARHNSDMKALNKRQGELKKALYGRFGSAINLEA